MPVLSEEAFLFLHDWVCNSKQHHPAKGEGLKFSVAFLLRARAPGTLSQHPAGACLNLRALPFCLDRHGTWEAPAERKLSCCWQLKLGAQLSLQSCPWLRKGSWSHICCCWPTIPPPCMVSTSLGPLLFPFTQQNAKRGHCFCSECTPSLAEVLVGALARGWDGNHPLLAAGNCSVGSHHLRKPYSKTAAKGGIALTAAWKGAKAASSA